MELLFDSPATLCILILTIGFTLFAFSNKKVWGYMALVPYRMATNHEYHAIVTSGLIHANSAHLGVNMLTLFFFGPVLEHIAGSSQFFAIYLISLVIGNLYPFIKYRKTPDYIAIGASGAVSGIVFAFCLAEPMATLRIFFALPMPAFIYAILYMGYSIYAMRNVQDNIGHEAHLAGAAGGIIATLIVAPGIVWFFQ